MALLDGKQLRNTSISLDKLNGTGTVTFTTATVSFGTGAKITTLDANILDGTDVVNKNYVDNIAAGLNPKKPVQAIALTSITLSGVGAVIDGWTVSSGDRILVNGQAGLGVATSSNGIYTATAGSWSRATDSDGSPTGEVSTGNFAFVMEGTTYEHSGWVLSITDASNPSAILVGTESQLWVQFSEQTNILAGDGLSYTGQNLNVNVGAGITISSDNVAIDYTNVSSTLGGAGLTGTGILNVGAGSGITVDADSVAVDYTTVASVMGGLGLTSSGSVLNVGDGAGISVTADAINVELTPGKGLTFSVAGVAGTLEITATNGLTFSTQGRLVTSVDNTTITVNNQGQLSTVVTGLTATGQPIYSQRNLTPYVTSGDGSTTGITLTSTPVNGINISVYVNGQMQFLGDGSTASPVDCYFGTSPAVAKTITNIVSGDTLYWNGTVAGYELSTTDRIDIIYNA